MSNPGAQGGWNNALANTPLPGQDSVGGLLSPDVWGGRTGYDQGVLAGIQNDTQVPGPSADDPLIRMGVTPVQAPMLDGSMGVIAVDPSIANWDFSQHNAAVNFLNGSGPGSFGAQIAAASASPNGSAGYCPPTLPTDDPQLVRLAAQKALSLVNPAQDESTNIQADTSNFAKVADPGAINSSSFHASPTIHGTAAESQIPGYPNYAAKMYNDPLLGNMIAVTHPTSGALHKIEVLPFGLGLPVNAWTSSDFLKASCPPGTAQ